MSTVCWGEQEEISLRSHFKLLIYELMNWETTYRDNSVSSPLQTATELQLIVRLFSVVNPAYPAGLWRQEI